MRFGMMWCSASIADTATSTAQKNAATPAHAPKPKESTPPATSNAGPSSIAGYAHGIATEQSRQRPRKASHETSGTLSYQRSSCPHAMHAEGGCTIERFNGTRAATTFRKLPSASPGAKAIAAKAVPTRGLSAAGVPDLRDQPLVYVGGSGTPE